MRYIFCTSFFHFLILVQIKWKDWKRKDGTDTTWHGHEIWQDANIHFVNNWKLSQQRKLQNTALSKPESVDIHDIARAPGLVTSFGKWELEAALEQKFQNLDVGSVDVRGIMDAWEGQGEIPLTADHVKLKVQPMPKPRHRKAITELPGQSSTITAKNGDFLCIATIYLTDCSLASSSRSRPQSDRFAIIEPEIVAANDWFIDHHQLLHYNKNSHLSGLMSPLMMNRTVKKLWSSHCLLFHLQWTQGLHHQVLQFLGMLS